MRERHLGSLLVLGLLGGVIGGCTSPVPSEASSAAPPTSASSATSRPLPEPAVPTSAGDSEPTSLSSPTSPSSPKPSGETDGGESSAEETSSDAPPSSAAPASAEVSVVVVWSGSDSSGAPGASGYAQVVEEGGECTLEMTGADGTTASASSVSTPDASTTSCGEIAVPANEAGPGPWEAVLRYESVSSSGASPAFVVGAP